MKRKGILKIGKKDFEVPAEVFNELYRLESELERIAKLYDESVKEKAINQAKLDRYERAWNITAGCGSHSCIVKKPVGMGTNGPCQCLTNRSKASLLLQRLAGARHGEIKIEK